MSDFLKRNIEILFFYLWISNLQVTLSVPFGFIAIDKLLDWPLDLNLLEPGTIACMPSPTIEFIACSDGSSDSWCS